MSKKEKKICCKCEKKASYSLTVWTITHVDVYEINKNGEEEYIEYHEKDNHDKTAEEFYYCKECYKEWGKL